MNKNPGNDAPTFSEWLEKYFEKPVTKTMYREKGGRRELSEQEAKRRWKKAYLIKE